MDILRNINLWFQSFHHDKILSVVVILIAITYDVIVVRIVIGQRMNKINGYYIISAIIVIFFGMVYSMTIPDHSYFTSNPKMKIYHAYSHVIIKDTVDKIPDLVLNDSNFDSSKVTLFTDSSWNFLEGTLYHKALQYNTK